MNDKIAILLASQLIAKDFLTKAAGCVQELKFPVKGKKDKKIPAVRSLYTSDGTVVKCLPEEDYKDLIPNSGETGILYFEDLGSKKTAGNVRMETWKGSLRLVCWLNHNKTATTTTEEACDEVKRDVPQHIENQFGIFSGKIKVVEVYPKRPSPFDRYTYDEKETQHLIFPYDYFSLKIEYVANVAAGC